MSDPPSISMEIATWISAVATAAGAGAAIAAVVVAYRQLTNLNDTLRMNGLMAVLQLEAEMNGRKQRVDDVAAEIRVEGLSSPMNAELIAILDDQMKGYLENWLNASDRLAYCILKGYLPERDWKVEYREYFADLVNRHVDRFQANTPYTNVLDLNNKWKRE